MRSFTIFTHSLLLATTPSLFLYPQNQLPHIVYQITEHKHFDETQFSSYDQIMDLLNELEYGELEERSTPEDLQKINKFVIHLAKKGVLPGHAETILEKDITFLLQEDSSYQYPYWLENDDIPPTLDGEIVLYKHDKHHHHHGIKKKFKKVKQFVKEHKKEIIIGAVIVVAVVVVAVVIASTAGAAAAAAGAAGVAASSGSDKEETKKTTPPVSANEVQEELDKQVFSFKDTILKEQFFQINEHEELSSEENGRILGSLFAHECFHQQFSARPKEVLLFGHQEIDNKFSTDYAHLFRDAHKETNFNAISYHMRGEKALTFGYYEQAVNDFGKAIELDPTNFLPHLQRATAYFNLRDYDHSLEDFHQYSSQMEKIYPFSTPEFCMGFAKGLPNGIYESGEGILLFLTDFATHPIHSARQMIDAFTMLSNLVRSDEWGIIAESLVPEIYQLATQWSKLPSEERGRLAGYALGKHGADILVPGAIAKVASKSVKCAQELAAICKNFQIVEETLILEAAAGIGNSAKVAEVVEAGQQTAFLAEELGITAKEMGQLKQARQLETTVAKDFENLTPAMKESTLKHKNARDALKDFAKKPLPEEKVRELIHDTGFPTFPRPKGIPEDYLVMISDNGAGMEYVHPQNKHIRVRVMPGKLHSSNPAQQKPYVVQTKDGKAFDKFGNKVNKKDLEAHIPLEEFIYRNN